MVKLHVAVKSDTGDRTRKVMVFKPTGNSPPSCFAHKGSESTYLHRKIKEIEFKIFMRSKEKKNA